MSANKWVLLVVAAVLIAGPTLGGWRLTGGGGVVPPPVPSPTVEYRVDLSMVTGASASADARILTAFYRDFADLVDRDRDVIATTGQLRETHIRAGKLMFQQTGIAGRYPGLAEELDAVFASALGLENVQLDDAKRQAGVDACLSIALAANAL